MSTPRPEPRRSRRSPPLLAHLAPALLLAGCVHVNLPDHLVSDTVDAGKGLYRSIAEAVSPEPATAPALFLHTCVRGTDAPVEEVKRACIDELVAQTKAQLKVEQLRYSVVGDTVGNVPGSVVVSCQIALNG